MYAHTFKQMNSFVREIDTLPAYHNYSLQRPTARDLLKHKFLKQARKTSYLVDLIERYRQWLAHGGENSRNSVEIEKDIRKPLCVVTYVYVCRVCMCTLCVCVCVCVLQGRY